MGVSTNVYTYFGVKLAWDAAFNDAYNDKYDDPNTAEILVDGMCGEYIIIGHRFYDSGDMRYGMEGGDEFKEIDINSLVAVEVNYRRKFAEQFPDFVHLIQDKPFRLMTFTHWH